MAATCGGVKLTPKRTDDGSPMQACGLSLRHSFLRGRVDTLSCARRVTRELRRSPRGGPRPPRRPEQLAGVRELRRLTGHAHQHLSHLHLPLKVLVLAPPEDLGASRERADPGERDDERRCAEEDRDHVLPHRVAADQDERHGDQRAYDRPRALMIGERRDDELFLDLFLRRGMPLECAERMPAPNPRARDAPWPPGALERAIPLL